MDRAKIRKQFPAADRYAYFNNAAIAPLARAAGAAMQAQVADAMHEGVHAYHRWTEDCEGLRGETAKMLGCAPHEIAITKNTSEGLCIIAGGLDWRPGDVVVGLASDFPANYVPLARVAFPAGSAVSELGIARRPARARRLGQRVAKGRAWPRLATSTS